MTLHFALPWAQPLNADGELLPGATLEFYSQGTTTPIVVYTNASRSVPHTWPVEANASGRFPAIFLPEGNYDVVLKDAEGVEVVRASGLEGTSGSASSNGSGSLSSIGRKLAVGSIVWHSLAEVPAGFIRIKKNKQALQKSAYPELNAKYALYSYPYGSTDETFNVPGGAGLFPRIWDDSSTWDPDASGRFANDTFASAVGNVIGSFQSSANLQHNHGPGTLTVTGTFSGSGTGTATSTTSDIQQGTGFASIGTGGFTGPIRNLGSVSSNVSVTVSGSVSGSANGGTVANSGGNESRGANIALPLIMFIDPSGAAAEETPALGLPYRFDNSTTDADPGTGELRLNGVPASATFLYISKTDLNSLTANALWTTLDAISGSNRGVITISSVTSLGNTCIFKVTGAVTDATSYWKVPITHLGGTPTFAAGNLLSLTLSYGGLQGSAGAAGANGTPGANGAPGADGVQAGRRWLCSTSTTMADPTNTRVRFNNATAASVTAIAISYTTADFGNPNHSAWVKAWDDSTSTSNRGHLIVTQIGDEAKQAIFRITDTLTDNTSWAQLVVAHDSGPGGFTDGEALSIQWVRTGDKGADGVGVGDVTAAASFANDNRLIRSDGTGKGVQASAVTVDDSGNVTGAGTYNGVTIAPWMAALNLGLAVSAETGALTIALKGSDGNDPSASNPVVLPFRSATATTGTVTTRLVTASTSLVISSGSTLGVSSSTAFRLWVVAFDDGGTVRLGVVNATTQASNIVTAIMSLADNGIASSTAEGGAGAADSAGVIYTGTAVTSKPYRIIGYLEWSASGVTAGTWTTTNLSLVQLYHLGIPTPGQPTGRRANVQKSDTFTSSTTTTWTDITGYSASIAPTSAANAVRWSMDAYVSVGASNGAGLRMVRGSTAIGVGDADGSRTQVTGLLNRSADTNSASVIGQRGLDLPQSASPTTYKVQFFLQADTFYLNRATTTTDSNVVFRAMSGMQLEEVMT